MTKPLHPPSNQITIYQTQNGQTKIDVRFGGETVWLTQKLIAQLFECSVDNISLHFKNIFKEGELDPTSVVEDFSTTAQDGKKYKTKHYNLDAIISVGYRVNSQRATQFRIWATQRLKEYIIKGFAKDTDVFFKTVQNKMHFAVTGKTAAEIISERVDKNKKNLGLTNFPGNHPIKRDIYIAKNYLHKNELQLLNRIVDAYLSFAEIQAMNEEVMSMKDWIEKLDEYLLLMGKGVLKNAGKINMMSARKKANKEFVKGKKIQDKQYISDFDRVAMKLLKKGKK